MSNGTAKGMDGVSEAALVARARRFREDFESYLKYVDAARDELTRFVESRMKDLREAGVLNDAHDAALNQLRGLRTRFAEVDAMTRSLLLLIDSNDATVAEEVLHFIGSLYSLEFEARAVQKRAALAAIFREYQGGHTVDTRQLSFEVDSATAKRFHSLLSEIREIRNHQFGRQDTFTPRDLLELAIALVSANKDTAAQMSTPQIFSVDLFSGGGHASGDSGE